MGADAFEITINLVKMIAIFLVMVQLVPLLVWVERRGSAYIQNRFGPNRVGPLGLTQLLADAVKFLTKEEFVPSGSYKLIFYAAPVVALIPAALAFNAIPLSAPVEIEAFQWLGRTFGPYHFLFQGFDFGVGIVFVLGVSSLAAYALLMAGWGSSSKFSLLGALRASAQMVSYELALGLSLVGILLIYNTLNFSEMIAQQNGPLNWHWMGEVVTLRYLPNWGIFFQPLGAILFFSSVFAETNRLPFDLSEAEGELVAGYHTEYGGIKMNMFYIGEYGHMLVSSALLSTFYFGGYNIPMVTAHDILGWISSMGYQPWSASLLTSMILFAVLFAKIAFFLWIFIWVRWTLPRFRYDQLMDLGWKSMLPWALFNAVATAVVVFVLRTKWGRLMETSAVMFYILAIVTLISAYKVVTSVNPIYSALSLAITMIMLSGLFFQLGAPFIAGVQMIVYAGAVMVLFVMVVMLFDLRHEMRAYSRGSIAAFFKIASAACLAGLVIGAVPLSTDLMQSKEGFVETPTKDLARLLFSQYVFAFEALGLLLLLVAVGVVAVARIKGGTHARI